MRGRKAYQVHTAPVQADALYRQVLERLLNDVAMPMQYYRSTGHGNWSSIRMMAPVIEALGKNNTNKRNKILKQVGIEYPSVFWAMYRHGLLHNDGAPQSIELNGKSIGWGFNWGQHQAAVLVGDIYSLNPSVIFDNLIYWLRQELNDPALLSGVTIDEALIVTVSPDVNSQLKDELEQIQGGRS